MNTTPKPTPPRPRRWKRLLQNLALFAGVFLLCGLATEIVLRICGYGRLEVYQPDPKLYWRLLPNQDCFTKIDHKPVHINSLGTRGPEFQATKPANTLRILSLGDSRTFGWGLTDEETYSRRLERALQQKVGSTPRLEVINAGVNAWSYPQMLVYFREFALQYKPDFVIVGEANLWTQFSEQSSPEFVKQFMWRVRLKNLLRRFATYHFFIEVQLKDVYERYRTKFIPVDPAQDTLFKEQQQGDPDAVFRNAIESLCQLARTNGVQPVLLYLPMETDLSATNTPNVLRAKREVGRRLNLPVVDLTDDLKPFGKELYLEADPVHLNARGNEIVAQRLFESMTNQLSR